MKFSAEWLDDGVSDSAELRATDCSLQILVGGQHVSRFVDNQTDLAHDRVALPAYPSAEGFARNWWSLVSRRTRTFRLRGFREGFALPDVHIRPDGRYVTVSAEPFEYTNPPVSFTVRAAERITIDEFERDLGAFIEATLDRLSSKDVSCIWLRERWDTIRASQGDEDERVFCEAAGALGIDPYTCPDEQAELIELSAEPLADDALPEFLAGCTLDRIRDALAWMHDSETVLGEKAALPDLPAIASGIRQQLAGDATEGRAWKTGYAAAAACRDQLDVPVTCSFRTPCEIASLFGALEFEVTGNRVDGLRAQVNGAVDRPTVIVAGPGHPASLNFSTMRAVGDYIVYGSDGRAPVTDTPSYRQAVGRAFAAEMLAPAEIITAMKVDGLGIEEIAAERNVSEFLIMRHLENHGMGETLAW